MTVVLSAVCLLLLVATLVLTSLLLGRRRRQRASFSPEKADLFGPPTSGGIQLESRHTEGVRQQSVVNHNHGVTTFKPVKRRPAVTVAVPEVPAEELPPPPPPAQETPQLRREGTPPLPPLPAEQRSSALPPQPDQLLPPLSPDVGLEQLQSPLASPCVVLEQLQPLQDPLPPPPQSPKWAESTGLLPPPADQLLPPAADQLLPTAADQLLRSPADQPAKVEGGGLSQLPPPPEDM